MSAYKILNTEGILRDDGALIPVDERNRDYSEYLAWVAAGNTPVDADPVPVRETTLSPSQQIILADGQDIARVVITGEPGTTIEYTINGSVQSIVFPNSGMDALELTCDTPNTTLLVQAGTARAVVYAVEVPS